MTEYEPGTVVLDPEDREQVDRLTKALVEAAFDHGNHVVAHQGIHPSTVSEALRSLSAKPKPEEPTGLGAVVEDAEGHTWVRIGENGGPGYDDWKQSGVADDEWATYSHIDAVRVLSEGVQS